jgi:hypothetical protein
MLLSHRFELLNHLIHGLCVQDTFRDSVFYHPVVTIRAGCTGYVLVDRPGVEVIRSLSRQIFSFRGPPLTLPEASNGLAAECR